MDNLICSVGTSDLPRTSGRRPARQVHRGSRSVPLWRRLKRLRPRSASREAQREVEAQSSSCEKVNICYNYNIYKLPYHAISIRDFYKKTL